MPLSVQVKRVLSSFASQTIRPPCCTASPKLTPCVDMLGIRLSLHTCRRHGTTSTFVNTAFPARPTRPVSQAHTSAAAARVAHTPMPYHAYRQLPTIPLAPPQITMLFQYSFHTFTTPSLSAFSPSQVPGVHANVASACSRPDASFRPNPSQAPSSSISLSCPGPVYDFLPVLRSRLQPTFSPRRSCTRQPCLSNHRVQRPAGPQLLTANQPLARH